MNTWKVTTASGETYEAIHLETRKASTLGVPIVLLSQVNKPGHLSRVVLEHHAGMIIECIVKDARSS